MIIVNSNNKIDLVNEQLEQMTGYHHDGLLGQVVKLLLTDEMQEKVKGWRNLFSFSTVLSMKRIFELDIRKKNASNLAVEISLNLRVTEELMIMLTVYVI